MAKDILSLKMQGNDAGAETIGEYLCALLIVLIEEKESFSSKRPFGNSGWENDLYLALVQGKAVEGETYTDGDDDEEWECLESCDEKDADKKLRIAICKAFGIK